MRVVSSMDPAVVRGLHAIASHWIVAIVVAIVVILISIVHCREYL